MEKLQYWCEVRGGSEVRRVPYKELVKEMSSERGGGERAADRASLSGGFREETCRMG